MRIELQNTISGLAGATIALGSSWRAPMIDGGVVAAPGMYLIGAMFLRGRKSTLMDGAGDDARDLSAHLASYLENRSAR